jgi:hypothetical protein
MRFHFEPPFFYKYYRRRERREIDSDDFLSEFDDCREELVERLTCELELLLPFDVDFDTLAFG